VWLDVKRLGVSVDQRNFRLDLAWIVLIKHLAKEMAGAVGSFLGIGNPHLVVFIDVISDVEGFIR